METRSTLEEGGARLPLYPLRVLRCKPGMSFAIRILQRFPERPRVFGLWTHYTNRSVYCHPDACPASTHCKPRFWKGYVSVDTWLEDQKKWLPGALEVTENLELDFRWKIQRGQVWELSCPPARPKKHFPVSGLLLEECDPATVPHALDLVPCLKGIYHTETIDLTFANPLPERVMVQPVEGRPPLNRCENRDSGDRVPEEKQKQFREKFLARGASLPASNPTPSPSSNGVHHA